jgi:hypothetical protein
MSDIIPGMREAVGELVLPAGRTMRLGVVTNVAWAFNPPTCFVDTGGGPQNIFGQLPTGPRQMRFPTGINPPLAIGDTVVWVENGASPFVMARLQGGTADLQDMQNLTYSGTWTSFGAGYEPGRYWKDPSGFVYVQLVAKGGTLNTTIATLPSGYRPYRTHRFVGLCGPTNTGCRIDIDSSGNITMVRSGVGGTNAFVSLVCRFQDFGYRFALQWTPVPWVDGWAPPAGEDNFPSVHVRDDGFCQARGVIGGGAVGTGGVIIPEYARVYQRLVFPLPGFTSPNYSAVRADVYGSQIQLAGGSNTELVLDGMMWDSRYAENAQLGISTSGLWSAYDNANFPAPTAFKDKFGVMHVRGLIAGGAANSTVATLQAGQRPGYTLVFPAAGDANFNGRLDVRADGTMVQQGSPGTLYFSLNGVIFRQEL